MSKSNQGSNKPTGTITETRSPKVYAAKCPMSVAYGDEEMKPCGGQGKIYAVAEKCRVDPETGERTQRRYVKCDKCGHTWGQDGPPATNPPTGEYVAGPCQEHEQHGEGRIAVQKHMPPTAICDTCGRQWQAIRKVE